MPKFKLVITDLDNTIWDWMKMWYNSFLPLLEDISLVSSMNMEKLKLDFKKLHQKYHTSECSFAYKELESITEQDIIKISKPIDEFNSIMHKYNKNKKNNIELYESVSETFIYLQKHSIPIVGFTESQSFFVMQRLKHLDLDGIFDSIYSPLGDGMPRSVVSHYQKEYWIPKDTEIRSLTKLMKKPNPEILKQIISDYKMEIDNVLYIGDKKNKDILMANQIGVKSVYASYGDNIDDSRYELLKEVTHWSDKEVKDEHDFNKSLNGKVVIPNYEIKKFSDIIKIIKDNNER